MPSASNSKKPVMIAVGGGSGSGKSTIVDLLVKALDGRRVEILHQDHYYLDLSHLPPEERAMANFDHPAQFDIELMWKHLSALAEGKRIERPTYDFVTHCRSEKLETIEPCEVLIFEGILALHFESLQSLFDLKVFVHVDDDLRFLRRLQRDIKERGRCVESVISQYLETVRPMHKQFISPSKEVADFSINWEFYDESKIKELKAAVENLL